jgi:hypothetical protein
MNVYFDWDDDPGIKPPVIRPIDWPPAALPDP